MPAMIVPAARDHVRERQEHTGDGKDRVPIAAVWECMCARRIPGLQGAASSRSHTIEVGAAVVEDAVQEDASASHAVEGKSTRCRRLHTSAFAATESLKNLAPNTTLK